MNDKRTGREAAFRVKRVLREEKGDNWQGKRIQEQRRRVRSKERENALQRSILFYMGGTRTKGFLL
ncbi:hypothetical protein EYF80_038306 [Liparis tanakae]|uniref:Uncharacterized protein n=1 Tax=Liparis tanakae TaxID=230148 RepID=A0A4Z2GD02_9TELE|nr:hypothetical protein EYF80_038306 [Liparis tanakae]